MNKVQCLRCGMGGLAPVEVDGGWRVPEHRPVAAGQPCPGSLRALAVSAVRPGTEQQ